MTPSTSMGSIDRSHSFAALAARSLPVRRGGNTRTVQTGVRFRVMRAQEGARAKGQRLNDVDET